MTSQGVCWVLTPGKPGMRSQALGLAQAVGLPIVEKRAVLGRPWSALPGGLLPTPLSALSPKSDPLEPPWPQLIVACGRKAIGPALAIKRLSRGQTIAAYVQNPELGRRKFDLIAAMPHDLVSGSNVVVVRTALHSVTQASLDTARGEWRAKLAADSVPLLGVLIGGDNASYRLTQSVLDRLMRVLTNAKLGHGMRVAATPSRRTAKPQRRILANALDQGSLGTMWDGSGANPYPGILALSDRLIVTSESISMISEALACGRPVHVLPLEGHGRRHDKFLRGIVEDGLVSLIEGDDLDWGFPGQGPINATEQPAARLRAMLNND